MGADPDSSAVKDRLQFHGTVKSVHVPGTALQEGKTDDRNGVDDAWKKMMADGTDAWIELEEVPKGELYLSGVNITFMDGEANGQKLLLGGINGNYLTIGMCYGMEDLEGVLSKVQPGDHVFLDNSDYIAIQSYYRHQVPEDLSFHAWDQFRDAKGKPTLPQRKNVLGYSMSGTGTVQDGNIQGKVIVTQALMDESTYPWCGDWYYNKVKETKGNTDDIRLYYMERCLHGDAEFLQGNKVVNYVGALMQALLDLSDWVERGIEPLQTTVYERKGGQIVPAATAEERMGMQPVITLLANGEKCAHVKVGEEVHFTVTAEVPKGAGQITAIHMDVEDSKKYPDPDVFQNRVEFVRTSGGDISGAAAEFTHVYDVPGTHMASVRVMSNRNRDADDIFTQVKNLDRVRVIVEC